MIGKLCDYSKCIIIVFIGNARPTKTSAWSMGYLRELHRIPRTFGTGKSMLLRYIFDCLRRGACWTQVLGIHIFLANKLKGRYNVNDKNTDKKAKK